MHSLSVHQIGARQPHNNGSSRLNDPAKAGIFSLPKLNKLNFLLNLLHFIQNGYKCLLASRET